MIPALNAPFRVAVPSRARSHNMPKLMKLLPFAYVVVDHTEAAEYSKVVPADNLILRESIPGCTAAHAKNWITQNFADDCVVMIDDDFQFVRCLVGMQRKITKPRDIYQIIENCWACAKDLNIGTFCWSRSANTFLMKNEFRPFRAVVPATAAFGIMGKSRYRLSDTTLPGREDIDWVLWELLENRILFADFRFYFDFGKCFSGRGGNVGVVSSDDFDKTTKAVKRRWGKYVRIERPHWGPNVKQRQTALSIRVKRHVHTSSERD